MQQTKFGGGGVALNFNNQNYNEEQAKSSTATYYQQLQQEKTAGSEHPWELNTQFSALSVDDDPSQSQIARFQSPVVQ